MKALLLAVLVAVLCVERGKGGGVVSPSPNHHHPATTFSSRGPPVPPQPWVSDQTGEGGGVLCVLQGELWKLDVRKGE